MTYTQFRINPSTGIYRSRLVLITFIFFLFLLTTIPACAAQAAKSQDASSQPTQYMIIVTGHELLTGIYADGHTYFLTRTLRPLGLECIGSMSVDDRRADLLTALDFAAKKVPLVIITGGLGPTDDDITRDVLSEFTNIPLQINPELLEAIARRFNTTPQLVRANLRRQTLIPAKGTYFANNSGTAAGLVFETPKQVFIALPGPPHELQPMVHKSLVPYLSKHFGTRLPGCSLTLRFVGMGQSQIVQTLHDHVTMPPDILVSSQFKGDRVDFTFFLPDDTENGRRQLQQLKTQITRCLGDALYAEGEQSLEECILDLLQKRNQTLTLFEIGSGGSLTAALTPANKNTNTLTAAFVAPTESQMLDLFGIDKSNSNSQSTLEMWKQLAKVASEKTKSPWIIGTGQSQTDKEGAVYIPLIIQNPDGQTTAEPIRLGGTDEMARMTLVTHILNRFRHQLK
ncbi:MAG: CinA family protein [Sedimentisphaerales bacterium]|nr:CinA family protein [Sedimentisphaerales bacterium]